MNTCALCKQKKELRKSHIVPRFVGKWLKATSATGFLRSATSPSLRLQDIAKIPLLCKECEEKLSRLETHFAKQVFYPFFKSGKKDVLCDNNLLGFLISLSWRTLLASYREFKQDRPSLCPYVDNAERIWRAYLQENSSNTGPYEHHMFFFDYVTKGEGVPSGFQWYTLRAVDATLVSSENSVFAYTKFPWMVFVSSIHPTHLEGWHGTKIEEGKTLPQQQKIEDADFGSFLLNRSKLALKAIRIPSEKIDRSIIKSIEAMPKRFLESETLRVRLAEVERARIDAKRKLPRRVVELVEIVERGLVEQDLEESSKQLKKWALSMIADTLARLPENEALKLDSLIDSAIRKSKYTGEDTICTFETNEIIIKFMVNLYYTKDQQRSRVAKELESLIANRNPNETKYAAVFSWNPFESDLPYESAFFVP